MLKISIMSGKLKGIAAINTNPLTNSFCQRMSKGSGVCSQCYSQKMLKTFRQSCVKAWERNSNELSERLLEYPELPQLNFAYVRLNAHGELVNKTHLDNLGLIAKRNPDTTFVLWTKRRELLRNFVKPANMILVYSTAKINGKPILPKGFDKVFTVYSKEYIKKHPEVRINCSKKCAPCLLCYRKNPVEFINEVLK